MNDNCDIKIDFPGVTAREAGKLCREFETLLNGLNLDIPVTPIKSKEGTQEWATILSIIVSAPFLVPLAKGFATYLSKTTKIRIKCKENEIVIENIKHDYDAIEKLLRSCLSDE